MSAGRKIDRIPRWKKILYVIFHAFFILLLGTGLIFAHDLITQSKIFKTEKIELSGNKIFNDKQLLEIAGVKTGGNLLDIKIKQVQSRLANHPWIKTASVKRKLPGRLTIAIEEEKPVAKVKLKKFFLMNNNGEIFKKFEKNDPILDIPAVYGLNFIDINEKNFYLQSVVKMLKLEKNRKKILYPYNFSKIQVDRDTGICIYNTNICKRLIMGFNDFEYKYQQLKLLTLYLQKKFPGQQLDKIDLSKKNRVVIKPFPAMG